MPTNKLKRIEASLVRKIISLNKNYSLIRPGNKIMVAVSGGKDSLALARLLRVIQKRVPFRFELEAVTLNVELSSRKLDEIKEWMKKENIKYEVIENNIIETVNNVVPEGKLPCAACARFRRGILYNLAYERKAVLALGHHADDGMETLLLNIFYSGKIQTMPPSLVSDDKRNRLIRPMMLCRESMIAEYAKLIEAPVAHCICPAKGMERSAKRASLKKLIAKLEEETPDLGAHLLKSLQNIKESNMMDPHLWDFSNLRASWEDAPG